MKLSIIGTILLCATVLLCSWWHRPAAYQFFNDASCAYLIERRTGNTWKIQQDWQYPWEEPRQATDGFYGAVPIWKQGHPEKKPPYPTTKPAGPVPEGIDPSDWSYMTPEERALWD